MKKLSVFTVAAFACLCFIGVMSGKVFADGTEILGPPMNITIESGSGVVAAGVGLAVNQTGDINIAVPDGSTVKQVLLYWGGSNDSSSVESSANIIVDGKEIIGELIGGPYVGSQNWNGLAFRADITDLDLVVSGNNTLTVYKINFELVANGAGVMVIYEKVSLGEAEISILDGHDFAYHSFDAPLDTTVPQTFTFSKASVDRTANLKMFFSSVSGTYSSGNPDDFRPTAIKIDIKHESNAILTTYWRDNELDSYDGEEWDTTILDDIIIPPGATSLTVQVFSEDRLGFCTDCDPASLAWITAVLSLPASPPLCSIGDFVWYDENNDGIQDSGESGIEGVIVNLYNCSDEWLGETTTDSNGLYEFTHLLPGDYYLEFIAPDGYTFSPKDQGADAVDSDANSVTGKTACTTLEAGENDLTWDAGLIVCGECEGKVTQLTLKYTGKSSAIIRVEQKDGTLVFDDVVDADGTFTFVGMDKHDTLGTEIKIFVNDNLNTKIHTSCSQPIGPGLVSGDFVVVSGYSKDGGLLCPTYEDDDCECDGKVTWLTLQYNGPTATIEVFQKKPDESLSLFENGAASDGEIEDDGQFTFSGTDKKLTLGTEISIYVDVNGEPESETKLHTSCSQDIYIGLKFGGTDDEMFEVIEGASRNGGPLCEVAQP